MKRLSILGAAALLVLAGCGSSSNSSSSTASSGGSSTGASSGGAASGGGGGQQLTLQADPSQLKFSTGKLTAKAGKVTLTMTNPSPLQHDIAVKGGVDAKGEVVGQGGKS